MKITWLANPNLCDFGGQGIDRFNELLKQTDTDALIITGEFCGYSGSDWSVTAGNTIGKFFPQADKSVIFTCGWREVMNRVSYFESAAVAAKYVNDANSFASTRMVAAPNYGGHPIKLNTDTAFISVFGAPDFSKFDFRHDYHWIFDYLMEYRGTSGEDRKKVSEKIETEFLQDLDRRLRLAKDGGAKTIVIWSAYAPFARIWRIDSKTSFISGHNLDKSTNPRIGAVISKHATENKAIKYVVLTDSALCGANGATNTFTAGNLVCVLGSRYSKNDKGQNDIAFHQLTL